MDSQESEADYTANSFLHIFLGRSGKRKGIQTGPARPFSYQQLEEAIREDHTLKDHLEIPNQKLRVYQSHWTVPIGRENIRWFFHEVTDHILDMARLNLHVHASPHPTRKDAILLTLAATSERKKDELLKSISGWWTRKDPLESFLFEHLSPLQNGRPVEIAARQMPKGMHLKRPDVPAEGGQSVRWKHFRISIQKDRLNEAAKVFEKSVQMQKRLRRAGIYFRISRHEQRPETWVISLGAKKRASERLNNSLWAWRP